MFTVADQALGQDGSVAAALLFYLFAVLSLGGAWAVAFSRNIVRMSIYLMVTLAGAAGLYFWLRAEFLAAVQLIVYVGGTLILIVFGVMLTSRGSFAHLPIKWWERVAAGLVGLLAAVTLMLAMLSEPMRVVEVRPEGYDVALIGRVLLSRYLLPFEIAAVLLLVVMVGAAYLARRRPGPM